MRIGEDHPIRVAIHGFLATMVFTLFGVLLAMAVGVSHGNRPPAGASGVGFGAAARQDSWPRMAIVIDDIGHSPAVLGDFLNLRRPLTFAVLPGLAHTGKSVRLIESAGREFLIHLPMEPFEYPGKNPGPMPLLLSLSRSETVRRVRHYIAALPGASGASNHMGSAFTYDRGQMEAVQSVLAKHRLFFLNSRTSSAAVPGEIARRRGWAYLERDVFLDHDPDEAAIERAFRRTLQTAKRRGHAIAIGHPYPETLAVLKRNLPRLLGARVRLVPLSRMVARPRLVSQSRLLRRN